MITKEQFALIAPYLPLQRGNVKINNYQLVSALLYVTENGCKWRSLPKEYGNWHTIYMRMSRWSKNGVLKALFETLQKENVISIEMKVLCMDSTTVKVHPDGTGALKKTAGRASADPGEDSRRKFMWSPHLTDRL